MGPRKSDAAPSIPYDVEITPVRMTSPAFNRRRSNNAITIEELSDDENAYDGDIEVVRPDQYEDVESDTEGFNSPPILDHDQSYWQNRLAEKMTGLTCNSDTNESQDNTDRLPSRKRRSREQPTAAGAGKAATDMSASLEIIELVDDSVAGPPAKRRRRKSRRSRTSEKIIHKIPSIKLEPRDLGRSPANATATSESSTTSPSSLQTPVEDAMDVD